MDRLASKITLRKTLLLSTAFSAFVLSTTLGYSADVDPAEENVTDQSTVVQNRSDLATPLLKAPVSSLREEQIHGLLETTLGLGSGISKSDLEQLLYPGCTATVVRWLAFEETLFKVFIYPSLKKRYLNLDKAQEDSRRQCGPCSCDKRIWPQQAIPVQSQNLLRRIAGADGFLKGIGFSTGVWSLLLASFLANDLYVYYNSPEFYGGNLQDTLLDIITLQSSNKDALASSLTKETVWPELVGVPLVLGLTQGISRACNAKLWTKTKGPYKETLLSALNHYHPSFCQDVLRWCLPQHPLGGALDRIEQALLWDGTLSVEDRNKLLQATLDFNRKARKLTQWKSLEILTNIADNLGRKDLSSLQGMGISREQLQSMLMAKSKSLQELKQLASHYRTPEASRYSLTPLPRYLMAHYLLWSLGRGTSYPLAGAFWLVKGTKLYSKVALLQTITLGISTIIIEYLRERDCRAAGKHWGYIPAVGANNCTVCGDFEVFYPQSFTPTDCLSDFLSRPRNTSEIIRLFQRIDWSGIQALDLSGQSDSSGIPTLQGQDLKSALQVIKERAALVRLAYNGRGTAGLTISSCQALARFIQDTLLKDLYLPYQLVGDEGVKALGVVLNETQVQTLDLSDNRIGDAGVEALSLGLPGSRVSTLNLGYNSIGNVSTLGAILNQTQVQALGLSGNQIGDAGVEALALGLPGSQVSSLDSANNNISNVSTLGAVLNRTQVQTLNLFGNRVGDAGVEALALGLPGSKVSILNLGGNGIKNVRTLGAVLNRTQIQTLDLYYNFEIDDASLEVLFLGLPGSKVSALDLTRNIIYDVSALGAVLNRTQVQTLDLSYNGIGYRGIEALALGLPGSKVSTLALWSNAISNVDVLGAVLNRTQVQELGLSFNEIGDAGVEALALGLPGSKVSTLYLRGNPIKNVSALGAVLNRTQVQYLDLWFNKIGDAGVEALALGLPSSKVSTLILQSNGISNVSALGTVLNETQVQTLDLSDNQIGEAGVEALALGLLGSKVSSLDLANNDIENVSVLGAVLNRTHVQTLSLAGNQIGDVSVKALALGLPGSKLKRLELFNNKIGDNGSIAIAQILSKPQPKQQSLWINSFDTRDGKAVFFEPNTALQNLGLSTNLITDAGASALCRQLPFTRIHPTDLSLSRNDNISAEILDDCGIVTSGASSRYSQGPVQLFKSLFWDSSISGASYLLQKLQNRENIPQTSDALPLAQPMGRGIRRFISQAVESATESVKSVASYTKSWFSFDAWVDSATSAAFNLAVKRDASGRLINTMPATFPNLLDSNTYDWAVPPVEKNQLLLNATALSPLPSLLPGGHQLLGISNR